MSDADVKRVLIEQMTFDWDAIFWPRMDGLTDEEYLWQPVADCWTVHDDGMTEWDPRRDPAPFTTIAWRINHMAQFFTQRWTNHFGEGGFTYGELPGEPTVDAGLAQVRGAYERWRDALVSMPDARLWQTCGPAEHRFSDEPFATLMLHINRELIHHAAECCLIRDLYRQRQTLTA